MEPKSKAMQEREQRQALGRIGMKATLHLAWMHSATSTSASSGKDPSPFRTAAVAARNSAPGGDVREARSQSRVYIRIPEGSGWKNSALPPPRPLRECDVTQSRKAALMAAATDSADRDASVEWGSDFVCDQVETFGSKV